MNIWQVARQLQFRIRQQVWPGVGGEVVFAEGSVRVTVAVTERGLEEFRLPVCMIRPQSSASDEEHPDLINQDYDIVVMQAVEGDEIGERSLIGGPRNKGQLSSDGRGLLELDELTMAAVKKAGGEVGIKIIEQARSSVDAVETDKGYITYRATHVTAWLTADRFYHPPTRLTAVDGGGQVPGTARLAWTLSPDRYDRREVVLRRAAGATPPSGPTDGTGVALGTPLETSVTDTPGAGQFSYAVFMGYDETGSLTNERFSEQANGTTAAVVVT